MSPDGKDCTTTTPHDPPTPRLAATAAWGSWQSQWAQVPESWRRPVYPIDTTPFDQVFLRNQFYLRANRAGFAHDFTPQAPARFADEIAWWVWLCWDQQLRKIEPSLLAWLVRTLPTAIAEHTTATGCPPAGISDLDPTELLRQAVLTFQRRNQRLPSTGSRRNIRHLIEHLHLWISVRCTETPWWSHDIWDLAADPRIPRREHEPRHDATVRLRGIEPLWLREGLRFWLRSALTYELLVWSSAADRARNLGSQLGRFAVERGYTGDPLIATDPDALRTVFLDYLEYLQSPAAATHSEVLTADTVSTLQAQTQTFYAFMHDHAAEAAAATGMPRWRDITTTHTILWSPLHAPKRRRRDRELTWYCTADLQRMLAYLDVLAAPVGHKVVLTRTDGTITVAAGLGNPQAARIWLLQALTGRRASEILMLDYHPLQAIPGQDRPADAEIDPDAFVARLHYQQTKVDDVIPTILVEQAIVDIIAEQQDWLKTKYPELQPRYLFLGIKNQHRGQVPRSYATYRTVLAQLDGCHDLTDSAGQPLRFSQTHRLRHTRATELLNDGVPFHVVQRYLGHKSPVMTARYAATLAATAEAEFLKHKKIGAHGAEIAISPRDIYEMTQLGARTDRILPNGVCLLPPLKTCDKGNACLGCGHFATDATHLDELRRQYAATEALLAARCEQYRRRSGRELGEDNIWVIERRRELRSLEAIIDRLSSAGAEESVAGAGTGAGKRLPLLQIQTRGAHPVRTGQSTATPPHRSMTAHRSTEGLALATDQRRTEARRKIKKALREMTRAGVAINPNAVARYAKVARKTIYNHTDLLNAIRAAKTTPRPQIANPAPAGAGAGAGSSIDAGLRQQLRIQKRQYDTDIADLKAEIKDLHQQLAVAHGEIHRLRSTQTG